MFIGFLFKIDWKFIKLSLKIEMTTKDLNAPLNNETKSDS